LHFSGGTVAVDFEVVVEDEEVFDVVLLVLDLDDDVELLEEDVELGVVLEEVEEDEVLVSGTPPRPAMI
jgi:hypothetical protein